MGGNVDFFFPDTSSLRSGWQSMRPYHFGLWFACWAWWRTDCNRKWKEFLSEIVDRFSRPAQYLPCVLALWASNDTRNGSSTKMWPNSQILKKRKNVAHRSADKRKKQNIAFLYVQNVASSIFWGNGVLFLATPLMKIPVLQVTTNRSAKFTLPDPCHS